MGGSQFAELISKIAHELRSPLTAVQGFSATLVKRWDRFSDDQKHQLVKTIHADALRMGRIISEVLDLARLETGGLNLTRADVDVAATARRAADNVAPLEGAERIRIEVEPDLAVWADASRLENILTNLLENAVKFSTQGPIAVNARRADDGVVEIEVTDEGEGIEEERLTEVFSGPAPAGQRATPMGSGLGLYLTKRLVEAHGGTIAVTSRRSVGSRFKVALPAGGAP